MLKKLFILLALLIALTSKGQTVRKYFFDNDLIVTDSTAIVLIIKQPRTQIAKLLNHRIYTDTTFIKYLKENWYFEYNQEAGYSSHRCGHDLYFYSLIGHHFTFLNHLNSNCELNKIGVKNLNILLQMGQPLHVDTLTRIGFGTSKATLFTASLFSARYEDKQEWANARTYQYPILYYDGYFKTKLKLDPQFTINQNAEQFIGTFTPDLNGINWNISTYTHSPKTRNDSLINHFINHKTACEIDITVYLKSSKFDLFKPFNIRSVPFYIKRGDTLLLFYKD